MAELLVRAKGHWMDAHTQEQIDALKEEHRESYHARTQIGDIIVAKPDDWSWGKEECLPTFLVVKMPGVDVATVEQYTQTLQQDVIKVKTREIPKDLYDDATKRAKYIAEFRVQGDITILETKETTYVVQATIIDNVLKKRRKFRAPEAWVLNKVSLGNSVVTLSPAQITNVLETLEEKTA